MRWPVTLMMALTSIISSIVFCEETTLSYFYETTKEKHQDITSIRIEIDRINDAILKLLTERTAYVKRIGDLKSQTTKVAEDRQRILHQEQIIIRKSNELELPMDISIPVFRAIVESSTKFQQDYIDHVSHSS